MSAFLLDVNVLIALIDTRHPHHDFAHDWFASTGRQAWATCPITQNGVLRIVGHHRYPNSPGSPGAVADMLIRFCALPGHRFWPGDISLLDLARLDTGRLLNPNQVTDSYLLALACAHGGKLATFDRRMVADAVIGGVEALHLIG